MDENNLNAVSLFTGAGIGDVGYRAAGFRFVVMSELEPDRAQLAKINFPDSDFYVDDIWQNYKKILKKIVNLQNNSNIFLITTTAPCQGMSKSGQGTLLKYIREGKRPKLDPRNRLILPALEIIKKVRPVFVVFENVCEMRNTIIEDLDGKVRPILEIIKDFIGDDYDGEAYDVEFADYGIPQRRKRLITVFTRDKNALKHFRNGIPLIPIPTHSQHKTNGTLKWIAVKDILSKFNPLDGKDKKTAIDPTNDFHRVSVLDPKKYKWIENTPVGASAFDNQCINPDCGYQGNMLHGNIRNHKGINQAKKDTPLYCEKCGSLLPRPYTVKKDGTIRIMSGYTSAYKRMDPDLPAPALTRNFSFPCSDNKVHPYQNRVLSLAEAFAINTLDKYEYKWGPFEDKRGRVKKIATTTLIRLVIGESIPPKFTEILGKHLIDLNRKKNMKNDNAFQLNLFQEAV
jgi:DNA (cytosine-5)-methyltransferase 1